MNRVIGEKILSSLKLIVFAIWKLKLDYIITIFLGIGIILYNKNEIIRKKQKTVILAMQRGSFNDDVRALREFPSKYKILFYPFILRAVICDEPNRIFPEELQEQTSFYAKKDKYEDLFERLTKIYLKTLDFVESCTQTEVKIILTANLDYYQDYSWISAIHKKSGKFIVLEKESMLYMSVSKKRVSSGSRYRKFGFVFEGDAVLFFNESAKESYVKGKPIKSNQAFVAGCPRVDRLVSIKKYNENKNPFILFASFMSRSHAVAKSVKLGNEILNAIYQDKLLMNKTIIKCKNSSEAQDIKKLFPRFCTVYDSLENYLKKNPAIFVGFNSTSCLDALIVGIPLVIPWWGDAKKVGRDALLGEHTSDFHYLAQNPRELIEILKRQIIGNNAQIDKESQGVLNNLKLKKFIEKNYSYIDGKNCQRFFDSINKIVT